MHNGIKKLFLTSLLVIFGLCINSSFAYEQRYKIGTNRYIQIVDDERTFTQTSPYNWTNISWTIDNIGNITTKESGVEETGLYLPINNTNNKLYNTMSIFWNNNELYYYSQDNTQGRFVYFCTGNINSYVSTTDNDFYKCISSTNGGSLNGTGNLLPIEQFNTNGVYHNNIVAFLFEDSNGNGNYNSNPSPFGFVYSDNSFVIFPIYTGTSSDKNFSDSLGITQTQPMSFTKFQNMNSLKQDAPIIANGGGETTTETTTIIGQCPTINEILSTYSSNYNTGICYSATRLLTQTGIVNTTAQSIFELYPTFTGWLEDYNYYRQYCENVPTSVCREAFSGNEIKWSLLNKTPENNPIGVYQYCHLQLNIQDKNTTTCVMSTGQYYATGVDEAIEEKIQGNQSVLDIMLNSFNNLKDELPSFSTGTVFDEFLEEGETWKDGFKLDIFKTFLLLWSKITSIFIFRNQYDGIIPTYITSIIVIILLFKIFKK